MPFAGSAPLISQCNPALLWMDYRLERLVLDFVI